MSNLTPLSTSEIVKSIKTVYINVVERVLNKRPLLFGLVEPTPTILISFDKNVPNNQNQYFSERSSYYLVSNHTQVFEILKELGIHRKDSEIEILREYRNTVFDETKPAYLVVTSFKPINFN